MSFCRKVRCSNLLPIFIVVAGFVPWALGLGAQITRKEFKDISALLEKDILQKYSSDSKDEFSDSVTQLIKGNLTLYHRGDVAQPVFLCVDKNHAGKKVVVIERGADYILAEDKNTFVVLRQKAGGKDYNVHTAIVFEMGKDKKIVVWDDVRIEQQEKSMGVLNMIGSRYLPRWKIKDMRPRCEWISSVLFCNAKKTVKAKPRKHQPLPATVSAPLRVKLESGDSNEDTKTKDPKTTRCSDDSYCYGNDAGITKPVDGQKSIDGGNATSEGGGDAAAEGGDAASGGAGDGGDAGSEGAGEIAIEGEDAGVEGEEKGSVERYIPVKGSAEIQGGRRVSGKFKGRAKLGRR